MKKSNFGVFFIGAALLCGAAYFWRGELITTVTGSADQPSALPLAENPGAAAAPARADAIPPAVTQAQKKTVASVLARHSRVIDGLNDALVTFGRNDPDVASAALAAAEACGDLADEGDLDDPRSGLMLGMRDENKIWAVEKLQILCEGFDAQKFLAALGDTHIESPLQALVKGGKEAQLASARNVVRTSKDRAALAQAGPVLIEKDELPIEQILGSAAPMGKVELSANWIQATALGTCDKQLGCGPDSPVTVSYCARMGCRRGVSYQEALSETLSPRNYRTVVAFSNWMRARGI